MTAALGPCSELFKYPHSNLYKNAKLRLNEDDRDFIKNLGGIYFIKSGNYIKIGKSNNYSARLKQLQTAHYNLLELIHSIPIMFEYKMSIAEKVLHKYFKNNLTESKNEWFYFTGELKKFVELKPSLHDLIDLISNSADPALKSKINTLKKRASIDAPDFFENETSLHESANYAAQEMEDLQLMLLNYNVSSPKKYIRGRRCKDWVEYAKFFFHNSDYPWSFSSFKYLNERLSRIPFRINQLQKIEANNILL